MHSGTAGDHVDILTAKVQKSFSDEVGDSHATLPPLLVNDEELLKTNVKPLIYTGEA
jgi:hypothetical protein